PLFVDFGNRHWSDSFTDWAWVENICLQHPSLPLVLARETLGASRAIVALLERCPKLYIETSCYQACGGIDFMCARGFGTQLLFGSGMPDLDAALPVSMLAYSRVEPSAQQAIAGGNLRRLLEGVG